MTNSLLIAEHPWRRCIGPLVQWAHRNKQGKGEMFFKGTPAELREQVRGEALPVDDVELVEALKYCRPSLRRHRFLIAPKAIDTDTVLRFSWCPPKRVAKPKGVSGGQDLSQMSALRTRPWMAGGRAKTRHVRTHR